MQRIFDKYKENCDFSVYAYCQEGVLFSFNEHKIQDGACVLKVFIMLEFFRQVYLGDIHEDDLLEVTEENAATGAGIVKFLSYGMKVSAIDLVELMVSISDHMAANILIDYLGIDRINKTIIDYGFTQTKLLKKYLVPRENHVGETSAYDYARLYEMLDQDLFLDGAYCEKMREILAGQRYKDFLAEPLPFYDEYIDMQSKTGKVDGKTFDVPANSCMNDGGICITTRGKYYVAFLSEIHHDATVELESIKKVMHLTSKEIMERYLLR